MLTVNYGNCEGEIFPVEKIIDHKIVCVWMNGRKVYFWVREVALIPEERWEAAYADLVTGLNIYSDDR